MEQYCHPVYSKLSVSAQLTRSGGYDDRTEQSDRPDRLDQRRVDVVVVGWHCDAAHASSGVYRSGPVLSTEY